MGDYLTRVGQVDALVDVQVAPFDVFGVEYKEFVQFIFKLPGVAKRNARRSNPRHHIERAGAVDFDLIDKSRPEWIVCGGLDKPNASDAASNEGA